LSLNFQRYYTLFPAWPESRRRRRRSLATICGAAVRKRKIVWRRGQEFERLIWSFWNFVLGFESGQR
jgi:hypothetical protein